MARMARTYNCQKTQGTPRQTAGLQFSRSSGTDVTAAFTLVEVLVGSAILAFTVVTLYGAFSFGFTTIKLSQEDVRADQILVQKLETLRIYDWSRITNNYIQPTFSVSFSRAGTDHGVEYDGTVTVSPFVPTSANESYSNTLRQVTASIGWVSGGVSRTRTMMTLVSQYGIETYKP